MKYWQTSNFKSWTLFFAMFLIFGLWFLNFATTPHVLADANSQIFAECDPNSPSYNPNLKNSSVCKTFSQTSSNPNPENPAVHLINVAANIVAIITGIAAVIMIIIGGFSFVTAGGNAEAAANARRRILYSIVGLAVVALAWTLVRFVTDRLIG